MNRIRKSGVIDVYVVRGEGETPPAPRSAARPSTVAWAQYLGTAAIVTLCGLIGWLSDASQLTEANIVMVFLMGVAFVATRYGRGPAIVAAVASVLVFDFFFVPAISRSPSRMFSTSLPLS